MKKLSKFTTIIFGFLFLTFSCQKEEIEVKPQPDPEYPTIYKPLSISEWDSRNAEFQQNNIHEGLSLNEYGFVKGEIPLSENDSVTADFVFENVGGIILKYWQFLGIENTENINLEEQLKINDPFLIPFGVTEVEFYFDQIKEYKEMGYWDELLDEFQHHIFFIFQNSVSGKSFDGPAIYFDFDEVKKVLRIHGNWFPEAIIPEKELYTKTDAVVLAYQSIKKNEGIDLWESKHQFRANKLIITREIYDKIEIRECWRIIADINDDESYYIFVDTQTGEIVFEYIKFNYII